MTTIPTTLRFIEHRAVTCDLTIRVSKGKASVTHEGITYEAPMPLCVRCGEPATDWVLVLRASLASCSTCRPHLAA